MRYEIRELARIEEFEEHARLQQVIWGANTIDLPVNILVASVRHGAVALGAYDGLNMIGMLYGFPAITHGRWHHHSHMLGVLPQFRRHGIGYALKQRQREIVLRQKLDLITWTVDPLIVGNNLFNFTALGVVCRAYIVNVYGKMNDELNKGLPSDRLEVEWHLRGQKRNRPSALQLAGDARMASPYGTEELLEPVKIELSGTEQAVGVKVPLDMGVVRRSHPDLALRWRLHVREIFRRLFADGYILTHCWAEGLTGVYCFEVANAE